MSVTLTARYIIDQVYHVLNRIVTIIMDQLKTIHPCMP